MVQAKSVSINTRRKESVITALLEWIPRKPGIILRQIFYRDIFAKLGNSVCIQPGVQFINTACIDIGDHVSIDTMTRINASGKNSWVKLLNRVHIDRGVEIKAEKSNCHIEIGEGTYIGSYTIIAGNGAVKIGKDCLIASHSSIYANNHNFADVTRKIKEQGVTCKGIIIEDDCWLGDGVKVLDGVTIGQGSVIGAGAVVTKDIPPYSVAVGVPAKVISQRNKSCLNDNKILDMRK